jgi:hypothetical protein
MKRYFFGSAAAVLCAGSLVAAQAPAAPNQAPQPQSGAQGERPAPAQAGGSATTTVTGCVYREQDVPGRSPNVAERAGVLEDYILADVRMEAGAGAATGTSGAAGGGAVGAGGAAGAGATAGTAGTGAGMYKLELIDDDRLQALVGKRVEVTGRMDREAGDSGGGARTTPAAPGAGAGTTGAAGAGQAQADRSPGPDRIELPEFEVTSIREIAGTCAATPSGR